MSLAVCCITRSWGFVLQLVSHECLSSLLSWQQAGVASIICKLPAANSVMCVGWMLMLLAARTPEKLWYAQSGQSPPSNLDFFVQDTRKVPLPKTAVTSAALS
eukprot:3827038-Amphidinium_carterae.2